ncbi:hypothetical protein [Haloarchaeobius sp. DYHT-AS-18]|uniref:hypothetical protein n=1 Tax=Haloarchaeobius sp. DYHT-AS-18 TaxID=3446117 RepID=UPI003EBA8B03
MNRSRRSVLAACGGALALSGCLSGASEASEATQISRLLLSNRLEEPRRVVLKLTRDGETVLDREFRFPPTSDGVMGTRMVEMDWPDDPAVYVLEAQYPSGTDYDGAANGRDRFELDPVPGGENDCTYVDIQILSLGGLTYGFGNRWCPGTTR